MSLGQYMLGDEVFLRVLCVDANHQPVAPTEAPTADVWSATAKVRHAQIPAMDRSAQPGFFGYRLFLGRLYAEGAYRVVYRWRYGPSAAMDEESFVIVPGGDPDGSVVSMFPYRRPQGDFVVQQLDSGKLVKGKNPRL